MQIDDGVLVPPLPDNNEDQGSRCDQRKHNDEAGFEPIVALTLVEDNLKRSQPQRYKTEADVVDFRFAKFAALEVGRILDEPRGEQQRNDADRDIDEENPAPGKVVG